MNKSTELVSIPYHGGKYRLCLDRVNGKENTYVLVWRGNVKTPDGYNRRPAHFHLHDLGTLIRLAVEAGHFGKEEISQIGGGLLNLEPA